MSPASGHPPLRRGRRSLAVVCIGLVCVLLAGAACVWAFLGSGRERADRPVSRLVLDDPPSLAGEWKTTYGDEGWETPGALYKLGLGREGTRSWTRPKDDATVDESVHAYVSPSVAAWNFSHRDPRQRTLDGSGRPETFDEVSRVRFPGLPGAADEARYYVGTTGHGHGTHLTRWVWLRFGQYVVQIQVSGYTASRHKAPPRWLRKLTRDAGERLADRAPWE
jgi:hypothetical protein